jgi:hypothetical protein
VALLVRPDLARCPLGIGHQPELWTDHRDQPGAGEAYLDQVRQTAGTPSEGVLDGTATPTLTPALHLTSDSI